MTKVNVTTVDGVRSEFDAKNGISLMENLRDNGYDDVIALCQEWLGKVGLPGPEEAEILEGSGFRKENSRLSCQIQVDDHLNGLNVELAPM